jgi:hypothetical protein
MAYLGEETRVPSVVGSTSHIDILGIGTTPDSAAREYETAVANAFKNAPQGTEKLTNIKSFKTQHFFLQVLGSIFVLFGAQLYENGANYGLIFEALGMIPMSANIYTLSVVATPE